MQLAPFFDVVSTAVYPALSSRLSMKVGHSYEAAALGPSDVPRLAADFAVAPTLVRTTIEHVATSLRQVRDDVLHAVQTQVGGETAALERMRTLIHTRLTVIERMATTR